LAGGATADVAALLSPDVVVEPAPADDSPGAAHHLVALSSGHRVLTTVASDERVAVLWARGDGPGREEGMDVLTIRDGVVSHVLQLASASNGAPAGTTPQSIERSPSGSVADAAANIELVRAFYREVFGLGDAGALDRLVAIDYVQHNPWVGQGREGLARLLSITGPAPLDGLGAGGVFAEGDHVVHISKLPFGDGLVLVDMFRAAGGMLVEHWDFTPLGMPLPMPPGSIDF
jgi:predicted SnoaL-like aldol condensation-catalyzing enzyme